MQNKNTFYILGALVAGLLIGFLIWGRVDKMSNTGMHQMPDGSMMHNNGMSMDDMMTDMMAGLEGKTGEEFDRAFLTEMIVHHQGAIEMAKAVLEKSKNPKLVGLAKNIIEAQTKEIEQMKIWLK